MMEKYLSSLRNSLFINNAVPFFPLVEALEEIINHTEDVMELIALIREDQFIDIRNKIITTFNIGKVEAFSGDFGSEIEFGDISDGVRGTTFSLYAQDTEMDKLIGLEERKIWCNKMIEAIDTAAKGRW